MTKECELCNCPARMYCESDKACLCWDCDEKIHSANFLVARHSRSLLCHVCHSVTNWSASGLKLGHTVSVCHDCVLVTNNNNTNTNTNNCCESENEDVSDRDSDDDNDEEDEEEEEVEELEEVVEEEEDGENQVVPWTPPPPVTSCSSSSSKGESSRNGFRGAMMKRRRVDADLDSDFDLDDETISRSNNYNTISTALTLRAPGQVESTASFTASVRPMEVTRTSEWPTDEVDNDDGAKCGGSGGGNCWDRETKP